MYVSFKNKQVDLFTDAKKIIRRFTVAAKVVNAQVNGSGKDAIIAITMENGQTVIYKSNGQIVRK